MIEAETYRKTMFRWSFFGFVVLVACVLALGASYLLFGSGGRGFFVDMVVISLVGTVSAIVWIVCAYLAFSRDEF